MAAEPVESLARRLTEAGFQRLFRTAGEESLESAWAEGENRGALEQIVRGSGHPDLARILASEVLYLRAPGYPSPDLRQILGYLYSRALELAGDPRHAVDITGNEWGFFLTPGEGETGDFGTLGGHLLEAGSAAVPHLAALLDDASPLLYVGSQESTLGASLRVQVRDAAAFFLGRILGIDVPLHDGRGARDAEIERLKARVTARPETDQA